QGGAAAAADSPLAHRADGGWSERQPGGQPAVDQLRRGQPGPGVRHEGFFWRSWGWQYPDFFGEQFTGEVAVRHGVNLLAILPDRAGDIVYSGTICRRDELDQIKRGFESF